MNYRSGLIGGSLEILQRGGRTIVTCTIEEASLLRQPAAASSTPVIRRG
jgi:hypothetical protein